MFISSLVPSSREEKGSGVTSPNPWASSRSVEQPIKLQSSIYWKQEQVLQSTAHSDVMKFVIQLLF